MPQGDTAPAIGEERVVPGTLLDGRYTIEREIGRGGMAHVFVAKDSTLQRDVAIKILRAGELNAARLASVTAEARTAGSLAHPNIVAIHDVGGFEGRPYIVQELLQGTTLREILRKGPLPIDQALHLGAQLARGLAAAHDRGIIHRDIKPENLFVTPDRWLKILDFGIATLYVTPEGPQSWTAPASNGKFAGTAGYMSPEQIQGRAVDPRSDLFSAGIVLHEMLSGRQPFSRPSQIETAWAILNDPPAPLPAGVPRPVEQIVQRCLEKDPAHRPQSARDLAFDLEMLKAGPRARPSKSVARIFAVALVATLAVAAALWIPRNRSQPAFRQLTFHRGAVWSARFAPDGKTVFYAVTVDGSAPQLHSTSVARPEPRQLDPMAANLLAVSSSGELAVLLRPQVARYGYDRGVLARFFPEAGAPREVLEQVEAADWSPDGSALAVVHTRESRSRLEYPINHVLYETTGWISHPRFSPDGNQIAFISHSAPIEDSGVIMVTDLAGSVREITPKWRSVQGLAWAKGGAEIWFTAVAADASSPHFMLRAVNPSGPGEGRVIARAAGDLRLQDVAPDGRALLTEPEQRLGLAILGKNETKARDFSWFDRTFLGDLSADGKEVLFTVDGPATGTASVVYLRKLDGSPPVRLGDGYGVALSPDQRWAAALTVPSAPLQPLSLLPTGPGEARTLEAAGVTAARVRWFADGRRLLIAGMERAGAMRLYVRDVEKGTPRPISGQGVTITGLAVSRDGRFAAAGDSTGRTTIYPVDGGDPIPLPELDPADVPVGFTDDGSLLVGPLRGMQVPVRRFDLRTRVMHPVTTLVADAPGALGIVRVAGTPDASTFAFNYASVSANLYQLEELQ